MAVRVSRPEDRYTYLPVVVLTEPRNESSALRLKVGKPRHIPVEEQLRFRSSLYLRA